MKSTLPIRSLPHTRTTRRFRDTLPVTDVAGRVSLIASVLLALFLPSSLASQVGGEGTSFTIVIPFTSYSNTASLEKVRLYLTSTLGSETTIRYGEGVTSPIDITLPPGGSRQVNLDTNDLMLPPAQGIFRRLLRVTSDNPVTVTVFIDRGTASEAYSAIPDSLCGFEYVGISETSDLFGTFMTVAALEDDTKVSITPTRETRNGDPAGVPFSVTLDRGEVYQLLSAPRSDPEDDDDLSGSRVVADRPVVVHGGSTCILSPVGNNVSCGPLVEQLPHVDALGKRHVFPIFRGEIRGFMRGVPTCGPVRIRSNEFDPVLDQTIEGDSGTTIVTRQSGLVTSSQRVLLAHIGTNVSMNPPAGLDGPVGDPSLSILVPERQMVSSYRFVVPAIVSRVDGKVSAQWLHFVTVTRIDPSTTATLNGSPLSFTGHVADTLVSPGLFLLESDGPVSVTVNGRSVSDAYAFVPGIVTRDFPLVADTVFGVACIDGIEAEIVIRNRGEEPVKIDRMEFLNDIAGRPLPTFPLEIDGGDILRIPVHFDGSTDSVTGRIVLYSGNDECAERVGVVHVRLNGMTLALDPPRRSSIRFPDLRPPATEQDTTVTLTNTGKDTIDIIDIVINPDRFRLLSPDTSFSIPPGMSREVKVRFLPQSGDVIVEGRIRFVTEPCQSDTSWYLDLSGKVRYYDVFRPEELYDTVYCGAPVQDTLTIQIANYESVGLRIDSLRLSGGSAGEFVLVDVPAEPFEVSPLDSLDIRVVYTPGMTGRREGVVELWGPNPDFGPYRVPVVVHADRYSFEFVPAGVSFGPVDCDTVTGRRAILRNTGTIPLRGFDVRLHRGVAFENRSDGPDPPGPAEELAFIVSPLGPPGAHRDTLHFVESVCGTDILLPVSVLCTDSGSLALSLPEISAEVAQQIEVPITIDREQPDFGVGIPFLLELYIRFSADILFPAAELVGLPNGIESEFFSDEIDGEDRIVGIRFSGRLTSAEELGRLPGTVLLGARNSTPLSIDSARFRFDLSVGDHIRSHLTTSDGMLNVTGYCEIGGNRFISSTGTFGMKIAPSPASTEIRLLLDLVEDGVVAIDLFDSRGLRVARLFEGTPGSGRWSIPVDVSGITQGRYFIRLETPTQTAERSLLILRD